MSLNVGLDSHTAKLIPQFHGVFPGGRMGYIGTPEPNAIGFVGWQPYKMQSWDISRSKVAFKQLARNLGLRTPNHWMQTGIIDAPFLFKQIGSAFGYGIRGPYLPEQIGSQNLKFAENDFAEAFIPGRIARAWYWGERLVVLEMFDMPTVVGNGELTYHQLLVRSLPNPDELPKDIDNLARFQGLELHDVVANGRKVLADFRYVSPFNPTIYSNHNVLSTLKNPTILNQFNDAGRLVYPHIPESGAQAMGFVLDAIVDDQDRVWFLEINSNPQLHPDVYPEMLSKLFGRS
ncbi:MAG TPA: hypothetical protein PKA20_23980 [Burkholderiaceae bacterium]|nr:hypothetical protein [Burkholderiaceae bacterium]